MLLFLFFSVQSINGQHKTIKKWVSSFCVGSDFSTELSQSKAVKSALFAALSESKTSTRTALLKMDLSTRQINKVMNRYDSEELIQVLKQIDNLSPRALRLFISDLADIKKTNLKTFEQFITANKENRLIYERVSKNLGNSYRSDVTVLKQINSGVSPVKLSTLNSGLLGRKMENAQYVKKKVSIDGIVYEGVFLRIANEAKLATVSLPKSLIGENNDLQFVESVKILKRQYLRNPEAFKKRMITSNQKTLIRDNKIFQKNKKAILDLEDKINFGKRNGDKKLVDKSLKNLRAITNEITFISTSREKPFEMFEMEEIVKKQIKDIQNPIASSKGRVFGLVWHHSEKKGTMELVEKHVHEFNKHTGGNALWNQGIR